MHLRRCLRVAARRPARARVPAARGPWSRQVTRTGGVAAVADVQCRCSCRHAAPRAPRPAGRSRRPPRRGRSAPRGRARSRRGCRRAAGRCRPAPARAAVDCVRYALGHQLQVAGGDRLGVVDDRAGLAPRHQRAVVAVGPVGDPDDADPQAARAGRVGEAPVLREDDSSGRGRRPRRRRPPRSPAASRPGCPAGRAAPRATAGAVRGGERLERARPGRCTSVRTSSGVRSIARRPNPTRSGKLGCAPTATPRSTQSRERWRP